jgi:hypothetical protein
LRDGRSTREFFNVPTGLYQTPNLRGRQNSFGEVGNLRLYCAVAHWHLDAANGMLNEFV